VFGSDLVIIHRKGQRWWFMATVVLFLWFYRSAYSGNPHERVWILDVLAVVFIGYMSLICFWVDSVQIKLAERVALSSTRTLFWRKTSRYRLERYNSVAIESVLGARSTRASFKIGLKGENQRVDWILECWPFEFAWDSAVRIANHLNLPVYDMMVREGRMWGEKEVPSTVRERRMRIDACR
jgi:hypothetical protein